MKLSKLALKHFRNLEPFSLTPHENLNLIIGLNAAGKTNLCEALYYASRGQLLKGERQRELIHWQSEWSLLNLEVEGVHIRILLNGQTPGKTLELNGQAVRQSDLFEVYKVLIFTPDDLQVIKGSPAKRRQLLDRSIADLEPAYRHTLLTYEQAIRRKNVLLRRERLDRELLGVYNQKLSKDGAFLIESRLAYLKKLNHHLAPLHRELTQDGKRLRLRYDSELAFQEGAETALQAALQAALPRERERGISLVGPHRDDLRFDQEGLELRRFGSQGQQKTALIALKLAQLSLFKERLGEYPILILDDVLSELDPQRTQLLLDHLPQDLQLFLTETHLSEPLARRAGKVFCIDQGRVRELNEEERCSFWS